MYFDSLVDNVLGSGGLRVEMHHTIESNLSSDCWWRQIPLMMSINNSNNVDRYVIKINIKPLQFV